MTANDWIQLALYFGVLLALTKPLGAYMARVYQGQPCGLDRGLGWLERLIYRLAGVDPTEEMSWKKYAVVMLLFNVVGFLAVYLLLRLQAVLPLNPQQFAANSPDLAFNTASSFATNTNWQSYGGETTMSYLSQMLALGVQNFLSAACGIAVLVALIRGLARRSSATIGNFWYDLVRTTVYILLPLALILALVLVSQGVIQNFKSYETATLVQPVTGADGKPVTEVTLPMGPAASQIAIKQLGTNGGGFFNVNSAHPFENPTPLANFLELLSILIISSGLCYTFGVMVGDTRQGWAVLAAMFVIIIPLTIFAVWQEQSGVPAYDALGVDQHASAAQSGGNMEGKETRFGIANSGLWASATTAASNGSVNSMHDSFTPLGGLVPMWLIQLGEIVFGGVGSGLYGMLMFVIVAVFVAGLMVGRTPEYLGKKIEAYEMKMASLVILIPPLLVLGGNCDRRGRAGAAFHRSGDQRSEKPVEQSRRARLFRSAVCVLFGRQQQRQRICRAERQHSVLQRVLGHCDVGRPVLVNDSHAGHRRLFGAKEIHAAGSRHAAHASPAVCGDAGRARFCWSAR